jgi:hypothetical protein
MSERKSLPLYQSYQESGEKFDYFVCGVAAALFAYIGQNYSPKPLGFDLNLLEPLSLLLLASSFFVGLKHLETCVHLRKYNFLNIDAGERAGNLTEALAKPGLQFNPSTGEMWTIEKIMARREDAIIKSQVIEQKMDKEVRKANRLNKVRDWILMLGFLVVLLSKITEPYRQ